MYRLILLSTLQSVLLVSAQVFLKFALNRFGPFQLSWSWIKGALTNFPLALSGLCMASATVLWMYILRHFEFNQAYPLISISYVLGTLVSIFVFKETIPFVRYIGIAFIILGVVLIVQK